MYFLKPHFVESCELRNCQNNNSQVNFYCFIFKGFLFLNILDNSPYISFIKKSRYVIYKSNIFYKDFLSLYTLFFFQIFWDFPAIFLVLIFSLIPLWSESRYHMISILLNLLCLMAQNMVSLVNVLCELGRNVCSVVVG